MGLLLVGVLFFVGFLVLVGLLVLRARAREEYGVVEFFVVWDEVEFVCVDYV
jgi:hypothetical protein